MIAPTKLSALDQSWSGGTGTVIADKSTTQNGRIRAVMNQSGLVGDIVVNPAGEDLGRIEGVMVDAASGEIAFVVIAFGGFVSPGTQFFAVPWTTLAVDSIQRRYVFRVGSQKLQRLDGFDKERWLFMIDQAEPTDGRAFASMEKKGPTMQASAA